MKRNECLKAISNCYAAWPTHANDGMIAPNGWYWASIGEGYPVLMCKTEYYPPITMDEWQKASSVSKKPYRVYIAGPMSGIRDLNRPAFFAEAERQRILGNIPVNPAILPDGLEYDHYMAISKEMQRACDKTVFLPDWEHSNGANIEHGNAIIWNQEMEYVK